MVFTLNQLLQHPLEARLALASFIVWVVVINDLLIAGEDLKLVGRDPEATAAVNQERLVNRHNRIDVKIRQIYGRIGRDVEGEER